VLVSASALNGQMCMGEPGDAYVGGQLKVPSLGLGFGFGGRSAYSDASSSFLTSRSFEGSLGGWSSESSGRSAEAKGSSCGRFWEFESARGTCCCLPKGILGQ